MKNRRNRMKYRLKIKTKSEFIDSESSSCFKSRVFSENISSSVLPTMIQDSIKETIKNLHGMYFTENRTIFIKITKSHLILFKIIENPFSQTLGDSLYKHCYLIEKVK